jgi:hypothetical protein
LLRNVSGSGAADAGEVNRIDHDGFALAFGGIIVVEEHEMVISLRPEVQQLIDDEVRAGRFATPEAVVEAAILEKHGATEHELDDETVAAIIKGREQHTRGEAVDAEVVREYWDKRLGRK